METWPRIIAQGITHYLITHVFLSLISLPILVAWGLPLSWLSPLGNIIFSPLLTLFLFVASLAFFSELIGVPHTIFDWLLERLTECWQWLLALAPSNTLYGFYSPGWWILLCIALIACASLLHPLLHHPIRRFTVLSIFLATTMALLRATQPSFFIHSLACNHGNVTLIRTNNHTILIDPGYIGARISANSWVQYTLIPELITRTGSLTIDHLIFLKPTILTCQAMHTVLTNTQIGHIYFPSLQGTLEGSFKQSFNRLYACIKQKKIAITHLNHTNQTIPIHGSVSLTVNADGAKRYQTITYPHILIDGIINGHEIDLAGR